MNTAHLLSQFRELLQTYQIDAYFVPSADEHLNEYPPQAKLRRQWLSGFTGSAGDFLVTADRAFLFVDARYYQQADQEVDPQLIQVCKLELEGHKQPTEVISDILDGNPHFNLGIDPFVFTIKRLRSFQDELSVKGLTITPIFDNLVDKLRLHIDRTLPSFGDREIFAVSQEQAGLSTPDKLAKVREKMRSAGAEVLPITKLDQIAWLLNLRGRDIAYNPVFIAYAVLTHDRVYLFTNQSRIPDPVRSQLPSELIIGDYGDYTAKLASICQSRKVWISDSELTYGSYLLIRETAAHLLEKEHPIDLLKAKKNDIELAEMQKANLLASLAKTRTHKWLSDQYEQKNSISEIDIANKIEKLYAESAGFLELSFPTIAGIGANGAIVHYGQLDPCKTAQDGDLILLDSGCQFWGGTTDDTRTFIWGEPTELQKLRYTEVLKAHINCAMTKFPKGTNGTQLDGITRANLWIVGMNYGHGTGHGVGAFLNVHEGPNGISKRSQQNLEAGMINSIEPGYYEAGWGGIRLENLYFIKEMEAGWLGFVPLTYIPFVRKLIAFDRLNTAQIAWLKNYYQEVNDRLAPHLTPKELAWLAQECLISDSIEPQ
jgi:Xaa-Pro aminopeptidase